jgi:hypothetical protein
LDMSSCAQLLQEFDVSKDSQHSRGSELLNLIG